MPSSLSVTSGRWDRHRCPSPTPDQQEGSEVDVTVHPDRAGQGRNGHRRRRRGPGMHNELEGVVSIRVRGAGRAAVRQPPRSERRVTRPDGGPRLVHPAAVAIAVRNRGQGQLAWSAIRASSHTDTWSSAKVDDGSGSVVTVRHAGIGGHRCKHHGPAYPCQGHRVESGRPAVCPRRYTTPIHQLTDENRQLCTTG